MTMLAESKKVLTLTDLLQNGLKLSFLLLLDLYPVGLCSYSGHNPFLWSAHIIYFSTAGFRRMSASLLAAHAV